MENDRQIDPLLNGSLPAAAAPRFKPCGCCTFDPNDWPQSDVKVTIRSCMTTCPYCGTKFGEARRLRKHIRFSALHRPQRLTVVATRVRNLYKAAYDASVGLFRPCQCCVLDPDDWPKSNAELVIRPCMTACPYCGYVYQGPSKLRRHIAEFQAHKERQLTARAGGNRDRKRLRTAVAPNEAHDAGNQGSPLSEDHWDSGDDSGNDDDFAVAILSGRSSAAAQNDTYDNGNQTYPMSQSPLLSIHGKNDYSNLARGLHSSLSLASAQNNAHEAINHGSPMDHTSSMGQVPPEPDHVNDGRLAETLPSKHPSAPTQNGTHDARNQGSPLNVVFPLSLISLVSQGSPVADHGSIDHGFPMPCHDRSNQRSPTSHIPPMIQGSPVPDHYINNQPSPMRQTPIQLNHNSCTHAYLVETSLNTYKSNLASLCTHAIGILHSDPSEAQRFLDDLKEIANQMFTDTQRSLDWQRSPGRRS